LYFLRFVFFDPVGSLRFLLLVLFVCWKFVAETVLNLFFKDVLENFQFQDFSSSQFKCSGY